MAHFQNQYGAVPVASHDPIQKEMDAAGDTIGVGGTEHVSAADDVTGPAMVKTTTAMGPTDEILVTSNDDTLAGSGEKDHQKKGIVEKIKEMLPGKHHHHHNDK